MHKEDQKKPHPNLFHHFRSIIHMYIDLVAIITNPYTEIAHLMDKV